MSDRISDADADKAAGPGVQAPGAQAAASATPRGLSEGRQLLCFLALILLGCGLLYAGVLSGDQAICYRDVYQNYEPMLSFMASSLQRGELPLWNPLLFTGTPQLAGMEPPLFYPPGWIFFVGLPFQLALVLNLSFHQLVAAAGAWLLGRSYGWSWQARALSATLLAFSGVLVSMSNLHPLLDTAVWFPWALWACHAICRQASGRAALGLGLVYGLQILSGHLEMVYFQSLLLLAYAGYRLWPGRAGSPALAGVPRRLGLLLAGLLLGLGLGAVQLLPALRYLAYTLRQAAQDGAGSQEWSYHPLLAPELLLPQLKAPAASLQDLYGEALFGHAGLFNSPYLGVTLWLLLPAGWLLRRQLGRGWGFYSLAALACLLLACGRHLPLYGLLLNLPGMGFFRYPSKLLFFAAACLALAAGFVLEAVLPDPGRARQPALVALAAGLAAGLLWSGLRQSPAWLQAQVDALRPELGADWTAALMAGLGQGLLGFAALSLAIGTIWALIWRRRAVSAPLLAGLLSVAALDLLASGRAALRTGPAALFSQPAPVAAWLASRQAAQPSRASRLAWAHEFSGIPASFRPELQADARLRFDAYAFETLQHNHSLSYGLPNLYGFWPARSQAINFAVSSYMLALDYQRPDFRHSLETLMGVRYLLSAQPPQQLESYFASRPAYQLLATFPEAGLELWENHDALPRLRFQTQALHQPDRETMIKTMAKPRANRFDPRRQLLLLDDAALEQARREVPAQAAPQPRWSPPRLLSERSGALEISLETNSSGYLVLADQNLPGWQAYDNGREVPILLANYLQRAIRLGPGQHRVRFVYRAPGLRTGALLSAASALLILLAISRLRRMPAEARR